MDNHPLQPFVSQLLTHTSLLPEEVEVLLNLPSRVERVVAEKSVLHRESTVQSTCVVLKGLLARTSDTKQGGRQIVSFYVSGEMADLQTFLLPTKIFALRAMSDCEVLRIPHQALQAAFKKYSGIAEALSRAMVRDANIAAEWVVNVGARTAKERIAHLCCEMAVKNGVARGPNARFAFPVTQAILGDAAGLSAVHVNRSIRALREDGLLLFEHGIVEIPNWQALVELAGFEADYLSPEQPLRFAD